MSAPRTFLFQQTQHPSIPPLIGSGRSGAAGLDASRRRRRGIATSVRDADRRWLGGVLAVVIFGALVNYWNFHDYVFEDSYITYSYAQSLAAGDGLVFNPGERVLGTTTPF